MPGAMGGMQMPGGGAPPISGWNFLNLFSFALLMTVVICVYTGVLGDARVALYDTHVTLLTPNRFVDIAWPIVFCADCVFVVFQFFPWYRASELVTVVTPFWCISCFLQVWWIIELGRDTPGAQAFAVALVCGSAVILLAVMLSMDLYKPGFFEYWIIRAPLSLHAGWVVCTACLQVNIYADSADMAGPSRLAIAVLTFTLLTLLTTLFSVTTRRPDLVFPIPVMWNTLWVFQQTPEMVAKIRAPLTAAHVSAFKFAAAQVFFACAWLIIAAIFLRGVVCCRQNRREKKIKEMEQERRSRASLGSVLA